jgi:hypothetical protein
MYAASHSRLAGAEVQEGSEAVMEGVEHLGQYVYEMTKAKVEALKGGEVGDVKMAGTKQIAGNNEEVDEQIQDELLTRVDRDGPDEPIKIDGLEESLPQHSPSRADKSEELLVKINVVQGDPSDLLIKVDASGEAGEPISIDDDESEVAEPLVEVADE